MGVSVEQRVGLDAKMRRLWVWVCVCVRVAAVTAAPGRLHSCLLNTLTHKHTQGAAVRHLPHDCFPGLRPIEGRERRGEGWKGLRTKSHT